MSQLVPIRNAEQLKKVLFLQKAITSQAKKELIDLAQEALIPSDPHGSAEKIMEKEGLLLEKYVSYPTLTEYTLLPSLADASKWGATFGVTLLIGELVFAQVRSMGRDLEVFGPVLRHVFVILLSELNLPKHNSLLEPLDKFLKVKARSGSAQLSVEQEQAFKQQLIFQLADAVLSVASVYGIVENCVEGGYRITPLGRRVLLHLVDASKFIEDMAKVHTRFQKIKPKLSMG